MATTDHHEQPYLPEVIFENIMTRVPVSTLMTCSNVCKHWYKSILQNPYFPIAYLAHQPNNKKDLPFVFYNLNVPKKDDSEDSSSNKFPNLNYIFHVDEDVYAKRTYPCKVDCGTNPISCDEKFVFENESSRIELVGNCNGLVCFSRIELVGNCIMIVNPSSSRDEVLTIFNPPIIKDGGWFVCCYGFGFDSFTHEYKVVFIVVKNSEFKCLVFTLGTNSWRETSTKIPLPVTTTTTSFYKSAIFCGGALFWRTKSLSMSFDNNMLLLSFDLCNEEFRVIQLPAECASSSLLKPQYQIIDPLLEFKGSPCVARLEKTILGGGSCTSTSTSTSYCYKLHLHILKEYNKVGRQNEQVWIKETFDVAPLTFTTRLSLSAPCFMRTPCAIYRPPPNRIMSSSDGRVFLYCIDSGIFLQIYDLQTKCLNIGRCLVYAEKFCTKKHPEVYDQIDYHLNSGHVENFMSMLAYKPNGGGGGGGAPPKLDHDELMSILDDKQRPLPVVGYLSVRHHKSADIYLL